MQSLQYPDGRQLYYGYSPISQVTSVSDSANLSDPAIETYGYLGLGSIVRRTVPLIPKTTPTSTTTGEIDEAVSLDGFGRVGETNWVLTTTNTPFSDPATATTTYVSREDIKYGYGADSNMTYRINVNNASLGEQYLSDSLGRQTAYYRGTLNTNNQVTNPSVSPASSRWLLDSQGNRYADPTGPNAAFSPYPSTYNQLNQPGAGAGFNSDGTPNAVQFGVNTLAASTKYDAWGDLTQIFGATASPNIQFIYDAIGRDVSQINTASGPPSTTHFFYNGNNVVEERDGSGNVTAQYVWAPDGTLVLRDRRNLTVNGGAADPRIPNPTGTSLNERIYALTDASGTTTAIAGIDGTILERYVCDANGRPQPFDQNWVPYGNAQTPTGADEYVSQYDWQYLWHGGRWLWLFPHVSGTINTTNHDWAGGGIYRFGGGSSWYDSYHGRPLQPDTAAEIAGGNAYDPTPMGLQMTIYGLEAGMVGAGIAAGFATGGIASMGLAAAFGEAFALSAAGTVAAGVLGGGAAGFGMGGAQGLANTGTAGGAWTGAWHGGLAGAAGGLVGASAALGAGALGLTCENLGATGGSVLRGAIEGGTGWFTGGFTQGGLDTGTLAGAWQEGLTGAWTGAAIGGGIGAILTNACFAAGTPMLLAERVKLPDGSTAAIVVGAQAVERLKKGDLLLSRAEFDPSAPLAAKEVEEIFIRASQILVVHVGGREIRTTRDHEFFVRDRGLLPAGELTPGDQLPSHCGTWTPVTKTVLTGDVVPVYNVRVADFHTYFVGSPEWGFSVLVHNTYSTIEERIAQTPAGQYGTPEQAARGTWTGERGRSTFVPADTPENADVLALLEANGTNGVSYRTGKPNFGPFAEGTVNTSGMTSDRRLNFNIADTLLAAQWDCMPREIAAYRLENDLTWHELSNLRTMQLIPGRVNSFFDHLGGVAEAKLAGL